MYEASIHRAYVSGVRNAENFLYIENQYFLGSAHTWYEKGSELTLDMTHRIMLTLDT